MAALAAPRGLLIFVVTCSVLVNVQGNLIRFFAANPPAFVNVSDLKSSIRTLVNNVGNRLRCDEHGLEHAECVKCLDTDNIINVLKLDPLSKSISKSSAEDLAVFLVHQILYFESMCISRAKGCDDIPECQDEVLEIMGRFSTPTESLVKILRIFKLYLKEDDDKECFHAEDILKELPSNDRNAARKTRQMITVIMGRVLQGQCIDIGESVTDFVDDIFHHYGDSCSPYMSLKGLKRMIDDLRKGQGEDHDHKNHDSHHHDDSHEHIHECDHKHAHFAHYHSRGHPHHAHNPNLHSYYEQNNTRPDNLDDHDHDNSNHDHSNHDHSNHDHYHSNHGHDHSNHDHDHSNHDHDHSNHDHSNHDHDHSNHDHATVTKYNVLISEEMTTSTTRASNIETSTLEPTVEAIHWRLNMPKYISAPNKGPSDEIDHHHRLDRSEDIPVPGKEPSNETEFRRLDISKAIPTPDKERSNDTDYRRVDISEDVPVPNGEPSNETDYRLVDISEDVPVPNGEPSNDTEHRRVDISEDVPVPNGEPSNETEHRREDISMDATLSDKEPINEKRRVQRSALEHTEFNAPSASLRSDLSHPEETHRIDENAELSSSDDVKKVYLLQNENHDRNTNLELSGTPHQFASLAAKCLSPEDLIKKFGHSENGTLTKSDFVELCPALIQQIVSGVCTDSSKPPPPLPSRMEVYGYGSLSVFIISLTSLAGVLLLPIMTKRAYSYIITGFYGLAFSTLAGDAMLHLMPQFLGLHSHDADGDDHGHSHEGGVLEPYVQLQLGVFFTIYGLFLFEAIMSAFSNTDHHSHQENKGHGHSHGHLPDELPTLISVKTKSETQLPVSRDQSSSSLDTEIAEVEAMKKPPNLMVAKPIFFGLTSMAIVVTLGDSVHNFGDGLAIGAAFSTGVRGGLSTAIAVFCHELPHEFGDFVVLLSTGLSFSKALWINFLSGLTCFAGLYIGILIGDNEVARKWVMAVTAGIFLYVALGEMLPELREHHQGCRVKMLIIKNIGILAGIGIMLLISVYESEIA